MSESQRDRRAAWVCAILTIAIVLPRSILISRAHSPSLDDDLHLDQGLSYLRGEPHPHAFYDPPFGKALLALPLYFAGCHTQHTRMDFCVENARDRRTVLYHQGVNVETLQTIQAVWKSVLFVPCVVVAFTWSRRLYGSGAGWLCAAIFLIEPNIAAHIPIAALDVLAMEGVVIASYLAWRYLRQPSPSRLIAASIATGAAILIKHTALLLPLGFFVLAMIDWFIHPQLPRISIRARVNALASAILLTVASMWMLSLFDVSAPAAQRDVTGISYADGFSFRGSLIAPLMQARVPCGTYIGSLIAAFDKTKGGHFGYLWGRIREHGWLYYFPAVALYKVPLGLWLIGALAMLSLFWRPFGWDELSIVIPMTACAMVLIVSGYNVGFRHALPTYGLILIFVTRSVSTSRRALTALAWVGAIAAGAHAIRFHPDYLSYTNGISRRPYLAISDSNLDWDQGFKQIGRWLDAYPQPNRIVWLDIFGDIGSPAIDRYIGERARRLCDLDPTPRSGVLILSPAKLVALFAVQERWVDLRDREPIDVIGHCLLVYDLDAIAAESNAPSQPTTLPWKSGR